MITVNTAPAPTVDTNLEELAARVDFDLAFALADLDRADSFDAEAWRRIPRSHMIAQARLLARMIRLASADYDEPTLRVLYCAGHSGCGRIFTQLFSDLFARWEEILCAWDASAAA